MKRETAMNIKLGIILLGLIIYLIIYSLSHYCVPKHDFVEQPYIKHVLAIPIIPVFLLALQNLVIYQNLPTDSVNVEEPRHKPLHQKNFA